MLDFAMLLLLRRVEHKMESSSDEEKDKHIDDVFVVLTSQKHNKSDKSQQGSTYRYSQPGPSTLAT